MRKFPWLSAMTKNGRYKEVKNIRFENLQINGEVIYDDMPDKPKWYKTGDMARIFVGEHTEDITFRK